MGRVRGLMQEWVPARSGMGPCRLFALASILIGVAAGSMAICGCAGDRSGPSAGGQAGIPEAPMGASSPASREPEDTRPVAISEDGQYRLRLDGVQWQPFISDMGRHLLLVGASLLDPDEGALLAWEDPRSQFVSEDGRVLPLDPEDEGRRFVWGVESGEGWFAHVLDPGDPATRMASLAYEVAVLRVRSWDTVSAPGIGRDSVIDLDAPPFRIRVESGQQVCQVTVQGGTPGFLDCTWAESSVGVFDCRGRRLEVISGGGGHDSYDIDFAAPKADGAAGVPISFPLEVRFRVPKEYDVERVPFLFRDIALPPRPGRGPILEEVSSGVLRSEWSDEVGGASLRLSLPGKVARGDIVDATLDASIDPGQERTGLSRTSELRLEEQVRLLLRNRDSGATVEVLPCELEWGHETPGPEGSPSGGRALRQWWLRFPLAVAWDALVPGTWEARASVEIPSDPDSHGTWSSTLVSGALALVVEEPPPERRHRRRLAAPTCLRLRVGEKRGTVDVAFGPPEAEVIEIEVRNGFTLGLTAGQQEDGGMGSAGYYALMGIPYVIDTLGPETVGPIDRNYLVELYEGPVEGRELTEQEHHRTLWKRSFRVTATGEEIEALRR